MRKNNARDDAGNFVQQQELKLCDYSLHAVASRPAELGETLISTDFQGSYTRGFANSTAMDVAVCLLPGTELAFDKNVRYRGRWFGWYSVPFNVAQFCKINLDDPAEHHDALAFPDGTKVLLNVLVRGQRARVLQLPAKAADLVEPENAAQQVPVGAL